jgi:DNA (cytosine-5)-methyltransferase 1
MEDALCIPVTPLRAGENAMDAIDLFAGAGGFSEGARMAGVRVAWAANHWPQAVEFHSLNHPDTAHSCQDLQQADWRAVPRHDIMLASPACQGHSLARGKDRPHHDALRSTAWAVVACAEYHRSPVILVENVPEFRQWVLYPAWCSALYRLGYAPLQQIRNQLGPDWLNAYRLD